MDAVGIDPATYAALLLAPTLATGQDADLKFEDDRYRLWLPRVTDADREEYGLPIAPVVGEVYVHTGEDGWRWSVADPEDIPVILIAAQNAGLDI